jgi:hypothetical protein
MSDRFLPRAANHDRLVSNYIDDLRALGRETFADYSASLFDSGVLFFDTSGRIVEATVTTKEAP